MTGFLTKLPSQLLLLNLIVFSDGLEVDDERENATSFFLDCPGTIDLAFPNETECLVYCEKLRVYWDQIEMENEGQTPVIFYTYGVWEIALTVIIAILCFLAALMVLILAKVRTEETVYFSDDDASLIEEHDDCCEKKEPRKDFRYTASIREKHRDFIRRKIKEEKEEEKSDVKIAHQKIYIPYDLKDSDFVVKSNSSRERISLKKVFYDPGQNEVFDIGTDVDDIVNEPSKMPASTQQATIVANKEQENSNKTANEMSTKTMFSPEMANIETTQPSIC
ncbi:unnamed protein product [Caenorhabditis bovis]|uniref:Uncharacterized protein n=1 Tax=Caenorhabditis bovis TaxID=2654633 RepID=A0A8S1F035_9PELO|nr:unnamed protein product [Caenorhabditis bovis]